MGIWEEPSRALTYPIKSHFWRWCSFSQGGISCLSSQYYSRRKLSSWDSSHELIITSSELDFFHPLPSIKPTWPLKMDGWETTFPLGWFIFRCELKFQGGYGGCSITNPSLTATVQSKWSTHVEVHQEICCHAWRRKWPTLVCKQNIPTMTNGVFDRDKQRSKWWGKWICKYMSRAPTRPLFSKVKARPTFQSKQGSFGFQAKKKTVSSGVQMIAGQSVNSPCVFGV